ncbi:phage protein [Salmonella enterica subsp. enterica serovar Enteritidis]|nr:phage protein [Salmonella enterica subsp. enterica serovar Enteritidis]
MSNIDKLNDHELVDLKNAIERELKRRADGPKVTTYYVVSCITDAQHFTDLDCALRCLKSVTEKPYGVGNGIPRKPGLRQSMHRHCWGKTPGEGDESRSLQHARSRKIFRRYLLSTGDSPMSNIDKQALRIERG